MFDQGPRSKDNLIQPASKKATKCAFSKRVKKPLSLPPFHAEYVYKVEKDENFAKSNF